MDYLSILGLRLKMLKLSDYEGPRCHGTKLITNTIVDLCIEKHIKYELEVPIDSYRQVKTLRRGIIDILITTENMQYAVEIDSSNKKWSLEKLKYMANRGCESVWVRWCYPVKIELPSHVHLIDITNSDKLKRKRGI